MFAFEVSRQHAIALAQMGRFDAEEERERQQRAEAWAWRCVSAAEDIREQQALQLAAEMARSARREQAEQRARAERQADAEDYRDHLLRTGQGRWRTLGEVLADARGVVR